MALNLRCLQGESLISTHSKPENLSVKESSDTFIHLPMEETSKEIIQTLNTTARLSPRNNGSALYNSYELRAVTYQLYKAMRQPSGLSPAYLCYLKSPFYSQCVNRENSKKVLCSHLTCATINRNASNRRTKEVTRGFAAKLWNKVKQGLLRSNNSNMQRKSERCMINCS